MKTGTRFSIDLEYEEVSLPPFKDILVITKKCPQGKIGITNCLNLITADEFEFIEVEHDTVEMVIVNKKIIKKVKKEILLNLLEERVFAYTSKGEIVKVNLKIKTMSDNVIIEVEE
ncbi:MAG: hypothetical protein HQK51_07375 [Oligoflexia bacterium]|nr:hypothetical protein [Oligoflexia bacterium]